MFKRLWVPLVIFTVILGLNGLNAFASSGQKKIDASFNNIKIQVDGQPVTTSSEPFIVNNATYLPLRDVSQALGLDVKWEPSTNTIHILTKKIVQENKPTLPKKSDIGGVPISEENRVYANVLFQKYGLLKGIPFSSALLAGDNKEITLEIELDLETYLNQWNGITDSEIESWLEVIIGDIQKRYSESTKVNGKIIRKGPLTELFTFRQDGDSKLITNFYDGNYRKGVPGITQLSIEEDYLAKHFKVGDIDFQVSRAQYQKTVNSVDITLTSTKPGGFSEWNNLLNSVINRDVKNLCLQVKSDFQNNAHLNPEQINVSFLDNSNKFIKSLTYNFATGKLY